MIAGRIIRPVFLAIFQERVMSELHRITVDPAICGGRPCLRGTRVRVKDVLDLLAADVSREEILADYPYLEAGDIVARCSNMPRGKPTTSS